MVEAGSAYKVSEMLREGGGRTYGSSWGLTDGRRPTLWVFTERLEHSSDFPFTSNLWGVEGRGGGGVLTGLVPGHWGSLLTHRKAIAGPFLGSRDFKGDFKGSRGDFKPFLGFRGDVS